jgi:hypothetical protein
LPVVSFEPRYALPATRQPDPEAVRSLLLAPGGEWGEAVARFEDAGGRSELLVLSHPPLGYYLRHTAPDRSVRLSVWDDGRLAEVVEPDDWRASAGLFVPPPLAAEAVAEFLRSGGRWPGVRWEPPAVVPAGGNW